MIKFRVLWITLTTFIDAQYSKLYSKLMCIWLKNGQNGLTHNQRVGGSSPSEPTQKTSFSQEVRGFFMPKIIGKDLDSTKKPYYAPK